ncbi:MAG: hypothetical protein ACI4M3_02700 [Acutalibacteraceae bacterium]
MSENMYEMTNDVENVQNCPDEGTVCIDAPRIYDSCGDKDCLEDMRVYLTESGQCIIDKASNVRLRDVDVITVYLDLEPVPYHKGFYSIDMTFFFDVRLDVFMAPAAMPVCINGLSVFTKKVILYGSEGNVKVFSSDFRLDEADTPNMPSRNLPKATVQVAEPIALHARLCEKPTCCPPCCRIPECICRRYNGNIVTGNTEKEVLISVGIFTIVQIQRNVQMLVPAYDFCVPTKECVASSDDPCELFNRIEFPTDEFFPPKSFDNDDNPSCGCHKPRQK